MNLLKRTAMAAATVSVIGLAACTENASNLSGQPTKAPMAQGEVLGRGAMVYRAPNINARQYTKFIIDPVQIYRGTDADWGGASEQDIQEMAAFIRSEMVRALGDRFPVVTAPGPDVARIKLTLAGLENNTPVLAPVSRVLPFGLAVNVTNQLRDKEGSFTGAVTFSGEVVDSRSNQSLVVFAQRRGPDALDIGATMSDRDAQKAAVTSFADAFRKRLDDIQAKRG